MPPPLSRPPLWLALWLPDLSGALRPRDPAAEAEALQALARRLSAFSARIVLRDEGLLLDLAPTLRLFGGLRALLRRLAETGRQAAGPGGGAWPGRGRWGLAPTATGAWLLAQAPDGPRRLLQRHRLQQRLATLPVGLLPALRRAWPAEPGEAAAWQPLAEALGCATLGALRQLPRAGLQARFGPGLLRALDRAWGEAPELPDLWEVEDPWLWRLELPAHEERLEALAAALAPAWAALAAWLQPRRRQASRLMLRLAHPQRREAQPDTVLRLDLAQAEHRPERLAALMGEKLARCRLPAAVRALRLDLLGSTAEDPGEGQLWPGPEQDLRRRAELIDRLNARLGPGLLRELEACDDHRPERAQRERPARALPPSSTTGRARHAPPAPPGPRPLWLLDRPEALPCDARGQPWHEGAPLRLLGRAERLEAGWFDSPGERRDYQPALGADQRWRWVFRRLDGPGADGAWFLHGWFG